MNSMMLNDAYAAALAEYENFEAEFEKEWDKPKLEALLRSQIRSLPQEVKNILVSIDPTMKQIIDEYG